LTKKSNLIGRLEYDLTQFFDNLVVTYFFGPPCVVESTVCKINDRLPQENR